ncbi:alanine racemase [Leucobacter zeae]|nr:alanine racemase [Leucobacter zeae]
MHSNASELIVHDDAIRRNTAFFRAVTGGRLMAVLKADAFGHGDVAHTVLDAGARSIGVTGIDEALALRTDGVAAPILSWLNAPDAEFESALLGRIELSVPSPELLHAIAGAARRVGVAARVHLHVDAGIGRDGCPARDWAALCALAREHEAAGTIRVVGVMGHLSCAETPGHPQTARERLVFANAVRTARRRGLDPRLIHLAATAATLNGEGGGFGPHRVGAGLFGIDPSGTTDALRPALTLRSTVVSAREAPAGTGVGYGHDFVTAERGSLALVPLGYGDGLPRAAAGRAEVLVRGRRRPVVGRISMDMIVVDTGDDLVRAGEPVTVFGPGDAGEPTVAEWADWAGTIAHEIVTGVGARGARARRIHDRIPADRTGTARTGILPADLGPTDSAAPVHHLQGDPSCRFPRPHPHPLPRSAA